MTRNEAVGNLFDDQTDDGSLFGALDESSSVPFGTLDAEITPETIDFFVSDAEGDPDCPSQGYSSIDQALNTLRQGKVAIDSLLFCSFGNQIRYVYKSIAH